jgi:hypothetical protein
MVVMHVGHVRVCVRQRFVLVRMGVGLARRILQTVGVAVMLVVTVSMSVHHAAMGMGVRVPLGEVQPNADGHQHSGGEELHRQWLLERDHRGRRADEGRGREICAGARRAEVAQRDYE